MNTRGLWGAALLLGTIGGCLTEQVSLVPPAHVRFYSVDYSTTLVWTSPSKSPSLKHYVQWKIYGEPRWLDVDECQGITEPKCDLSNVTSGLTEWYYARVHSSSSAAKSAWTTSRRFSPRWDSKISPPLLKLHATPKGITVRVKPPRAHAQVRMKHSDLLYKIILTGESGQEKELEMECCSYKLKDVKRKARYCFQAQTILPLQARSSVRTEAKCITSQ
uniref:Interleukin 22 receptor, alpha 2 n=1 Tax=Neogobius melanostomus TaxID=47308 RepID=A0A8C6US33_9GOBI